jgi:putative acetyltransferase
VTVRTHSADLDDPRVDVLLGDHLAEMEPTALPGSRHALTAEQFRMRGVRLWVADPVDDPTGPLVGSVARVGPAGPPGGGGVRS